LLIATDGIHCLGGENRFDADSIGYDALHLQERKNEATEI